MDKRKKLLWGSVGFLCGLVFIGGVQLATYFIELGQQVKLSCNTIVRTEYCVYFRPSVSLLSSHSTVLIGPSPDRGVVFSVPYGTAAKDIEVIWGASNAVTLRMQNATLSLEPSIYIDSR